MDAGFDPSTNGKLATSFVGYGSWLLAPGFWLPLCGRRQTLRERGKHSLDFEYSRLQVTEIVFGKQMEIAREQQMVFHLIGGTASDLQESFQFSIRPPSTTLGNIRPHRGRCSTQLTRKTIHLLLREIAGRQGQLMRPYPQKLEAP